MSQDWMSIIEYARHFNISDMTVRRRIRTGRIRAELRDGKYYIPVDSQATMARQPSSGVRFGSEAHLPFLRPQLANHPQNRPQVTPNPISSNTIAPALSQPERSSERHHDKHERIDELIAICQEALRAREQLEAEIEGRHIEQISALSAKVELLTERTNQLTQKFEDLQMYLQMIDDQGV